MGPQDTEKGSFCSKPYNSTIHMHFDPGFTSWHLGCLSDETILQMTSGKACEISYTISNETLGTTREDECTYVCISMQTRTFFFFLYKNVLDILRVIPYCKNWYAGHFWMRMKD